MQDDNKSLDAELEYFTHPLAELDTVEWAKLWSRPGLDVRQRSLISVGIVAAQGRYEELATQVRGAVTSGCTQEEIQETILQAAAFGGREIARRSLCVADAALKGLARWRPRRL